MQQAEERGYTMMETIMYISLLIILGGVLAGYAHNAIGRYKTGRVVQQVLELKKAILQFTSADENYDNLTIAEMNTSRATPMDMRYKNEVRHALNGRVYFGSTTELAGQNDVENAPYMFYIRFDGLPRTSCVEILTQGQFYSDGSDLDTLIAGDTAWRFKYSFFSASGYNSNIDIKTKDGDTGKITLRPNISEALDACKSKNNNTIIWIFS